MGGSGKRFIINVSLVDTFNINRVHALPSFLQFKLYVVVSLDFVNQAIGMYEGFFTGFIVADEAITFFFVEKLYSSSKFCVHCKK